MNRSWLLAFALLAAGGLAACAVGPDFVPPAPPRQAGYTARPVVLAPAGRSDPGQHLELGAALPAQWWRRFASPALDAAVAQALADSPSVEQAQAVLAQAQQAVRVAASGLYPQAEFGVAAERAGGPAAAGETTLVSAGPLVSYAPDLFGATRRGIEQQQALAEVQQAQLDATRLNLAANVAEQAIAIASARAQLAALDTVLAGDRDTLQLVRAAVDGGTAAGADLAAAQAQLAADQALLPPLRQQQAAARDALAMLVGHSAADWAVPDFKLEELRLPTALPVTVPSELVRARPDIRAAEARLHAASAAIGVASAALYPQLTLSAAWTQQAASLGALFEAGGAWSLAADLSAPLFRGGALRAQREAAVQAWRAELGAYRQTVLLAFNQVADVLQALDHDAQAVAAQRQALDAAQESLRLAQDSYAAGAGNVLQVLVAQRSAQQARLGYARATAQRYADTVQLFAAMGGDIAPARTAASGAR